MSKEQVTAKHLLQVVHRRDEHMEEHVCPLGLGKDCLLWTPRGCQQKHGDCRTAKTEQPQR